MLNDMVNHPSHYTQGGIECIDALEAATSGLTGIEAVCTANAIKYLWRWKQKNGIEDLEKARWYINRMIDKLAVGESAKHRMNLCCGKESEDANTQKEK